MGNFASKRHGRQGKPVQDAAIVAETESRDADDNGNGQASADRVELPADSSGQVEAGYAAFTGLIQAHNLSYRSDMIVRAWFPDAKEGASIATICSDVEVLQGDASYQLTTGEIIAL